MILLQRPCYRIAKLSLLMALTIITTTSVVSADCISCFALRGVRIELKNGHRLVGYVLWYPSIFNVPDANSKFPAILLDPGAQEEGSQTKESIYLYTKVFPVSRYLLKHLQTKKLLVSTKSEMFLIRVSQISKISAVPRMRHEGYEGVAFLPVHSKFATRWLTQRRPNAVIDGGNLIEGLIISYNPRIGRRGLQRIRDSLHQPVTNWEDIIRSYERKGVIFLSIPED